MTSRSDIQAIQPLLTHANQSHPASASYTPGSTGFQHSGSSPRDSPEEFRGTRILKVEQQRIHDPGIQHSIPQLRAITGYVSQAPRALRSDGGPETNITRDGVARDSPLETTHNRIFGEFTSNQLTVVRTDLYLLRRPHCSHSLDYSEPSSRGRPSSKNSTIARVPRFPKTGTSQCLSSSEHYPSGLRKQIPHTDGALIFLPWIKYRSSWLSGL